MQPRHQWLLLFLGAAGGDFEVDQVRAMKGLFLLSQVPGHPAANLYKSDPYDYGPFDSGVYRDLDALKVEGLVEVVPYLGSTKRDFRLTDAGRQLFEGVRATIPEEQYEPVAEAKRHVTTLTFGDLLKDIYARFPGYRERSVAPEAREFA